MNTDELLTKLANEFRYWPVLHSAKEQLPNLPEPWRWEVVNVATLGQQLIARKDDCCIGRIHWEKRREELINEPDDADAPEWAEWVAQDEDGEWCWYVEKPHTYVNGWSAISRKARASFGKAPAGHDWRKTLRRISREERPVKRQAADGVNTETVNPDGSVTSTMVNPPQRHVYDRAKGKATAAMPPIESRVRVSPRKFTPFPTEDVASEHDPVNHPSHYMLFPGIESIDIIQRSLTPEQFAGFCMGNALKYRLRAGEKGDAVEDLGKANWYRDKLKEVSE